MVATTFSIDTPLYVAGVVTARRRRHGGPSPSATSSSSRLRAPRARRGDHCRADRDPPRRAPGGGIALRAFIFAVPINVIGMGYAMLAARKVVVALGFGEFLPPDLPGDPELWAVVMIVVFTLVYAGLAGLWGVVATDFFQFFLALFGAVLVAIIAVADVGGLAAVRDGLVERGLENRLAFLPLAEVAQLSVGTFLAYIGIQWWAFRRSDGGGEFIQRLSASKDEAEERAAWFFNILNYVVRTGRGCSWGSSGSCSIPTPSSPAATPRRTIRASCSITSRPGCSVSWWHRSSRRSCRRFRRRSTGARATSRTICTSGSCIRTHPSASWCGSDGSRPRY